MLTASTTPLGCGEARRDRPLSAVFSLGVFGRPLALGLVFSVATVSMAWLGAGQALRQGERPMW